MGNNVGIVTCGPSEALIISGVFHGEVPKVVIGGRTIIFPGLQVVQRLPLNTHTLVIESNKVYTSQGVPISVTGIAQVKIWTPQLTQTGDGGKSEDDETKNRYIRLAAEQFGSKGEEAIAKILKETFEGHQRAMMGAMTVEQIVKERKVFAAQVFDAASKDVIKLGMSIVSYTIKDITDEVGYLKALGMSRTAQVQRDARIGEAEAKRDTEMAESEARMQQMEAKLANETEIARAKRSYDLKKATYDVEVNTAKAEAEKAYELQAAAIQQKIKEQEIQIRVVERQQQIEIAEQEIMRKEKELDSIVKKPAEAEKYRLEKIAEANRLRKVLEAEADAEALQLKGESEAFAIEAKATAEAEQMAKKADAWKEYKKAALVDMMLKVLPKVAAEVAAPLSKVNKMTFVADANGEIGAARITEEILSIMTKVPEVVNTMTGVDIKKIMN